MGYAETVLAQLSRAGSPRGKITAMIGARLGKWILDKELGRGGMGRVYMAHEESNGNLAALKVLAAELAQETGFLKRFQREIEVLSQLSHPNIVQFYESGVQEGLFYYAMEYVAGDNYEQLLLQHGRLPWKEVLDAALQICPALKHAHDRGIVHRDIKPPNILRDPTGIVKITDFGIAKVFSSRHLTNTGGVVGTAEYLSPEQAQGKQATKRSDLYSLGVVLYQLLTGRLPFEGRSSADILHKHAYGQFDRPIKLVPEMPYDVDEVVCQLLEKDPNRRPGDAMVLQRRLDSIMRKLERKSQHTMAGDSGGLTVADNPDEDEMIEGPATLMSRLMREELERQNRGSTLGNWLNRPVVLLPLFLLCVALIVWAFLPRRVPPAETLFAEGSRLMFSAQPSDWDRAWTEYLEPLNRNYPGHPYGKELKAFQQKLDDHAALRKALAGLKGNGAMSEAQRLYLRGLRHCQDGDAAAAANVWHRVVNAYRGIDSEARWVDLAEAGLSELRAKVPAPEDRRAAVRKAIDRANRLRAQGKAEEAEEVLQALAELYRDDPGVQQMLKGAAKP